MQSLRRKVRHHLVRPVAGRKSGFQHGELPADGSGSGGTSPKETQPDFTVTVEWSRLDQHNQSEHRATRKPSAFAIPYSGSGQL
jgi:hypothetical protein